MTLGLGRKLQQHGGIFPSPAQRPQGNTLRSQPNIATELFSAFGNDPAGTFGLLTQAQITTILRHYSPSLCDGDQFSAEHRPAASATPVCRLHTSKPTQIREDGFSLGPSNSGINNEPSCFFATIDVAKKISRIELNSRDRTATHHRTARPLCLRAIASGLGAQITSSSASTNRPNAMLPTISMRRAWQSAAAGASARADISSVRSSELSDSSSIGVRHG